MKIQPFPQVSGLLAAVLPMAQHGFINKSAIPRQVNIGME
jgi:hypothetical protein